MAFEKVHHRCLAFTPLAEDADRERQLAILLDEIRQRLRVAIHVEQIAFRFEQRFVDRARNDFGTCTHFVGMFDFVGHWIRRRSISRSRSPTSAAPGKLN